MLRELPNVMQVPGEPRRRWFFCDELDLVVWIEDGTIRAFQLAYDKHRNEHSLEWDRQRGFTHYVVDDGEPFAGIDSTPMLYANGPFDGARVRDRFLEKAAGVPDEIAAFVERKLRVLDAQTEPTGDRSGRA